MRRPAAMRVIVLSACALAGALALDAVSPRLGAQIPTNGVIYACIRMDRDGDEGRLARLVAAN